MKVQISHAGVSLYNARVALPFILALTVILQPLFMLNVDAVSTGINLSKQDTDNSRVTIHTAANNPLFCVKYDASTRLITVTCKSANLGIVENVLRNPEILRKERDGSWLLNANLTIADGADFTIDSNNTKWLKINSTSSRNAYHIDVIGNMKIDSVKITSWNTTSNNYTKSDGTIHRAAITVPAKATGKLNIKNSEIAYLGYGPSLRRGISYFSGNGSILENNTIHDMWYGFYSKGFSNARIVNNNFYSNSKYGLYFSNESLGSVVENNYVHDNHGPGIVCSFECNNMSITGNRIGGNSLFGLVLSRNVADSKINNNIIQQEPSGIFISESHDMKIQNNTISKIAYGINAKKGSYNISISNNSIHDPTNMGILIQDKSSGNELSHNIVLNPGKYGICVQDNGKGNSIMKNIIIRSANGICVLGGSSGNTVAYNFINNTSGYGVLVRGSDVKNNTFTRNTIDNAKMAITVDNNTESQFNQNTVGTADNTEYYMLGNSVLNLKNTSFTSDKIKSGKGNGNIFNVLDSGIIGVRYSGTRNETRINTNENPYSVNLQEKQSIVVRSIK